jgi:phospholipid-binding lipoprotein MlaA
LILPPLAPALLLLGQAGHGADTMPQAGHFEIFLQSPDEPTGQVKPNPLAEQSDAMPSREVPPVGDEMQSAVVAKPVLGLDRQSAPKRVAHAPGDPLEGFNRKMFAVQDGLDRAIIRPAAIGYRHVVPKPVRGGLRHFISNLTEPIVFLNYLLQLKPGKAAETLVRFTVNSTIGVGGVLDLAKLPSIGLPHRPNGFGNTLGFYGIKPGPYLFLPLVGPTNLRDFLGGQADNLAIPVLAAGKPFNQPAYLVPNAVIGGLDQREQNDDDLRALYAGAVDPYASLRSVYLQDRKAEIDALHHRTGQKNVASPLDESLDDPEHNSVSPGAVTKVSPLPETVAHPQGSPDMQDPLVDPAIPPKS